MNNDEIKQIIKQTITFYEDIAEEFSKTRKSSWNGWNKLNTILSKQFKKNQNINVLDLGCGNGRFYEFLANNLKNKFKYTGVDASEKLLTLAQDKYANTNFIHLNIFGEIEKIKDQYDLITMFGVAHHIPDVNFRQKWFKNLTSKMTTNGILVVSFWNIQDDERFRQRAVSISESKNKFENGDFYYDWGKLKKKRFTHIYSQQEIEEIAKKSKLQIIDQFYSDGKSGNLNKYLIFKLFSL